MMVWFHDFRGVLATFPVFSRLFIDRDECMLKGVEQLMSLMWATVSQCDKNPPLFEQT